MRTIFFTLALLFTFNLVSAQAEKPDYKAVAEKFDKFYNKAAYDSIFAMFAPDMKKAMSAADLKIFLESVRTQNGKIQKREFKKYLRTYAFYKTTFEKSVLALKISLDEQSRINGLLVNPYGDN
jgi:hypothetical protein